MEPAPLDAYFSIPELTEIVRSAALLQDKLREMHTIEQIGLRAPELFGISYTTSTPWYYYWMNIKREFYSLLCTDSPEYKEIRASFSRLDGQKSQLAMVSSISAAVASNVGLIAGVITPLCALCLIAVQNGQRGILQKNL